MENKIFEANPELQDYIQSIGFVEITSRVFRDKKGKKAFKRKGVSIYFDYINVSISQGNEIVYWEPTIDEVQLDSLISTRN